MRAEIVGFSKEFVNVEVDDGKGGKVVESVPIAMITLRSDVPEVLPVGKIVELIVVKDKKK